MFNYDGLRLILSFSHEISISSALSMGQTLLQILRLEIVTLWILYCTGGDWR